MGLRKLYKERTGKLTAEEKEKQSQTLVKVLASFLAEKRGAWAIFSPLHDEPQLLDLLRACTHLQWCFPLIKGEGQPLEFYEVESIDKMVKSSWGVLEPNPVTDRRVLDSSIQGCLVPGIAFDHCGVRLGRGAGYYDRSLQKLNALKVGVTFDSGLAENLIKENHDQIMNIVVSPNQWIEVVSKEIRKEVSNGN